MATSKSKTRRKVLVFTAIGLVVAGLTALAIFRKREVVIPIQTEKVTRRNLIEVVVANGKVQPVLQVKISPEVSGEIIELPVKEGQKVNKGDLLLRIKPDYYQANRRSAEAGFQSSLAAKEQAAANLKKAEVEFKRNEELFQAKLISDSDYIGYKTTAEVAKANFQSSQHQVEVARAALARADEELAKTTIYSPICGTISKLNSELGERVVGTAMMSGTDVMTVADLNEMEARVDIGEIDVVLIAAGQKARLEVDAFRDRKFAGTVTEIANSSKTAASSASSQQQDATRFEVKIRIQEKEPFRPGMSVTAEVETRSRTNVLCVPIQSVTTRLPKPPPAPKGPATNPGAAYAAEKPAATNAPAAAATNGTATAEATNASATATNIAKSDKTDKKSGEGPKPIEVVFVRDGDHVKMAQVKHGISDEKYTEITEGLTEGQEIVSGGYKAISRDLEDGKKVKLGEEINPAKEKK